MLFKNMSCILPAATVLLAGSPDAVQGKNQEWLTYIGTYSSEHSRGIYLARFDSAAGSLTKPELVAEMSNPSFLALHPKQDYLYAVSEAGGGAKPEGSIRAFSIDRHTGKLFPLGEQSSAGRGPCHLAVDHTGKCLLVANYNSGSIAVLPILQSGALGEPKYIIQHRGSSVNKQRQEGPHAHFIISDPGNRFALVCDLGLDKVLSYALDPG